MTPKEKAEELFNKYYSYLKANLMYDKEAREDSKVCALIATDELIKYTPSIDIYPPNYQKLNTGVREYWKEVKQELEKL